MKDRNGFNGRRSMPVNNSAKQRSDPLKVISWILAYAVWIFIFLIPVIGIVVIVIYLLKNRSKREHVD
jgi:ABC-type Fe3+ transport system permease subunit